ncbi:MAG: acyl--CoA ligase [Rhodospirillales bacterium]|nr:acyl--CoA ligase [Rhodospirillales bacterium]
MKNHAREKPDHPAIEEGERIITYSQLSREVEKVAANLWDQGIRPSQLVALYLPDSADHLIVVCGLIRLGAIIWPLDFDLNSTSVNAYIEEQGARAIVAAPELKVTSKAAHLILEDLLCPNNSTFIEPEPDDDKPFALIQSSGTTGKPKYVYWNFAQLRDILQTSNPAEYWVGNARCFSLVHMYQNSGCRYLLRFLMAGATVVINNATTDEELVEVIKSKQVSYLLMLPTHLRLLTKLAENKPLLFPNLKIAATISAAVSPEQLKLAQQTVTPNIHVYYGTNECGLVAIAAGEDYENYPGSAGRLVEGFEAEVVDKKDNKLPPGQVGLLRLRAPNLPTGYLNNPKATALQFNGGWFYPGDLALINANGNLFFKGRADDCINRSGLKFYPTEVEKVLLSYPGVIEAAVFGWPHETYGEVAVAYLVAKKSVKTEDLQKFWTQNLPPHKWPTTVMFVKSFPKNAMSKVIKSKLKENFSAIQTKS